MTTCLDSSCQTTKIFGRGMCQKHYTRWRKTQMPTCSKCTKPAANKKTGLCAAHYDLLRRHGTPEKLPERTVDERFWAFVEKTDSCWLWTGGLGTGGYAVFSISHDDQIYAHRFSYEKEVGPIPVEKPYLDHVYEWGCRHRHCVRPTHLEPVTQAENNRRAAARKTHCPQGHEYTVENTYRTRDGYRMCRICMKAHAKKRNAKLKAARAAARAH